MAVGRIPAFGRRGLIVGVGYRGPNPEGKITNPFAAQFAEVEVDTRTGEVRVLRFLAAHDSGRVLNPLTFRNQVFGGITMGLGFGLTEERVMDRGQLGKVLTAGLHDYKLPTALDVPADMALVIVDPHDTECNSTGAKGVGEPATIPTAPAIANAVFHATGVRLVEAPMNPMRVLAALTARTPASNGPEGEGVMLPAFTYVRARSVSEAATLLASPGTRAHAGGTDLLGCLRDHVFSAERIVSLGRDRRAARHPADQRRRSARGGADHDRGGRRERGGEGAVRRAGAGRLARRQPAAAQPGHARRQPVPAAAVLVLPRRIPLQAQGRRHLLRHRRRRSLSRDLRRGIGCYVVHPSDTAPALVRARREHPRAGRPRQPARAGRRVLRRTRHGRDPRDRGERGELVTEILLPAPRPGTTSTYRKVRARGAWDFALAGAAVAVTVKEGKVEAAKIVLSGVAPVPWRVPAAEQALVGRKPDVRAIAQAAEAAAAKAEPMGQNGYKVALVRGVVAEALEACVGS